MLTWLHKLARWLKPFRLVFFGLIILFALLSAYSLLASRAYPSPMLQLGVSGILWCLMLLATIELFQTLPRTPGPQQGWFLRQKLRIARVFYYGLAILICSFSLVLIWTSIRLLRI